MRSADLSRRQERRGAFASELCVVAGGEVLEDMAFLLPERSDDREHPLDEAASCGAVRTEASLAPEDGRADCPFRGIVTGRRAAAARPPPGRWRWSDCRGST